MGFSDFYQSDCSEAPQASFPNDVSEYSSFCAKQTESP